MILFWLGMFTGLVCGGTLAFIGAETMLRREAGREVTNGQQ